MRGYLTFHENPNAVQHYLPQSADFIGGSIFATSPSGYFDILKRWAEPYENRFFHLTMSLPPNFTLAPAAWLSEVKTHLTERRINPSHTPWVCARDTSTAVEHVHAIGSLVSYDGRFFEPITEPDETDRMHLRTALRLGLPAPDYTPRSRKSLMGRVVKPKPSSHPHAHELPELINEAFESFLPRSVVELDRAVKNVRDHWSVIEDYNQKGLPSILFVHDFGGGIRPSILGRQFYPRALFQRFDHCRNIRAAQTIIGLLRFKGRVPLTDIERFTNKHKERLYDGTNAPEPHLGRPPNSGNPARGQEGCGDPASSFGPSERRGRHAEQLRGPDSGNPGDAGRTFDRGFRNDRCGQTRPQPAQRTYRKTVEAAGGPRPLIAFLAPILRCARAIGKFVWRLKGGRRVEVDFDDGSSVDIGADKLAVFGDTAAQSAIAFAELYSSANGFVPDVPVAAVVADAPVEQAEAPSPDDQFVNEEPELEDVAEEDQGYDGPDF